MTGGAMLDLEQKFTTKKLRTAVDNTEFLRVGTPGEIVNATVFVEGYAKLEVASSAK